MEHTRPQTGGRNEQRKIRHLSPARGDGAGESRISATILLVDADDPSRQAVTELLREGGHMVIEAGDGLDGLGAAREQKPDLLIVDLWPFFSGSLQMLEALKTDPRTSDLPVLVLTGDISYEQRTRALAVGCEGFLEKPCPPEQVLAETRRILASALAARAVGRGRSAVE